MEEINSLDDRIPSIYEKTLQLIGTSVSTLRAWLPCFCCCIPYPYKCVSQGYTGLRQRFGQFDTQLEPGFHLINPCTQSLIIINLKTFILQMKAQVIITKDNISVQVQFTLFYRIISPISAYYQIQNLQLALQQLCYSSVRTVLAQNDLKTLIEQKYYLKNQLLTIMNSSSQKWGVYLEQIYLIEIYIDNQLLRILNEPAKMQRQSRAKIISASADVQNAKLLSFQSDILDTPAAMQLRYLHTLEDLSNNKSLIIVPLKQ